ncbi:MAG: hypothetical protein HOJ79_14015 [Nitrospina sp.]|nr:hypothetical protein [Nitrospina sp.]
MKQIYFAYQPNTIFYTAHDLILTRKNLYADQKIQQGFLRTRQTFHKIKKRFKGIQGRK